MSHPKPPVGAHVNLRDFRFMPLDVARLWDSDLAGLSKPEEFKAAVLLWCKAWHQEPAGSMPNDEAVLARAAGYGTGPSALKDWKRVRAGALRGFVLCSDGRLYHDVVSEKANEAWTAKLRERHKRECDRIRKAAQRANEKPVYPTFEAWRAVNDVPELSHGTDDGSAEEFRSHSDPEEKRREGKGEGRDSYISVGGFEGGAGAVPEQPKSQSLSDREIDQTASRRWPQLVEHAKQRGRNTPPKIDDPFAAAALKSLGGYGWLCDLKTSEHQFQGSRFKAAYAAAAREASP